MFVLTIQIYLTYSGISQNDKNVFIFVTIGLKIFHFRIVFYIFFQKINICGRSFRNF